MPICRPLPILFTGSSHVSSTDAYVGWIRRTMFDRVYSLGTWGLASDPRVWLLIVILGVATFGRSGFFRSRWFNLLKPWKTRPSDRDSRGPNPESPRVSPLRDPWFLFLLVLSATAVASWIVMTLTASGRNRP